MGKHLVIVESPAKAKTIEKYLGKDYTVLASYGHVRDLPSKNGAVDVDNDFEMNYQVPADSEKQIKAITKVAKESDTIYLATDLDREGEAISWHVLEELKKRVKGFGSRAVKRIAFSEITKSAIQNAVSNPRDLNMTMVDAQQARRALDYLVGFNLSPVLWRKVRGGLSAGRVQSVALRLICERENEIEAFVPEEYWTIDGQFATSEGAKLKGKLWHYQGKKVEKFTFTNEAQATAAVQHLQPQTYTVKSIEQKKVQRRPAAPFITSTLQQDASRKLGFAARRTMQAAQRLYEAGHITYMRTDAVNLANEAIAATREMIQSSFGADYVPAKPVFYKGKSKNAQEAHEAIRPTNPGLHPRDLPVSDADQKRLYDLIWKRTIACQMANAIMDQTAITLQGDGSDSAFRASGSVLRFDGFLRVYREGRDDSNIQSDEEDNLLPDVKEGEQVTVAQVDSDQHFTEPPPRYSEASLVKALEEHGIGRPSTYASIIGTLQDRGYVRIEQRRFFPEDVGRVVNKFLTEHFAQYVDVGFTAKLEDELDAIARGEEKWKPMLRKFWEPFTKLVVEKTESVRKRDVTTEETGEKCPKCDEGDVVIRLGRYGRFKSCNRYPDCDYAAPINADGTEVVKEEPKSTGVTCPQCNNAEIGEKKSRRGKVFYSCNDYPKCKYAIWDPPLKEACPECEWPIITLKSKKSGDVKKCPSCEWQDPPMTEAEKKRSLAAKERFAKMREAKAAKAKAAKAKKASVKKKTAAKKTTAKKATTRKKTAA